MQNAIYLRYTIDQWKKRKENKLIVHMFDIILVCVWVCAGANEAHRKRKWRWWWGGNKAANNNKNKWCANGILKAIDRIRGHYNKRHISLTPSLSLSFSSSLSHTSQ